MSSEQVHLHHWEIKASKESTPYSPHHLDVSEKNKSKEQSDERWLAGLLDKLSRIWRKERPNTTKDIADEKDEIRTSLQWYSWVKLPDGSVFDPQALEDQEAIKRILDSIYKEKVFLADLNTWWDVGISGIWYIFDTQRKQWKSRDTIQSWLETYQSLT